MAVSFHHKASLFLLGLLTSIAITRADGAMMISVGDTAPTTDIVASQTTTSNGYQLRNTPTSYRNYGQSFQWLGGEMLDRITLQLNNAGAVGASAPGANIQLEIFEVFNQFSDAPTNPTPISIQTAVLPASGMANDKYLTFDIDDVALDDLSYYMFFLTLTDAADANLQVTFQVGVHASYGNGKIIMQDNTTTYSAQANDLVFYLQSTPVPEPGSLGLLAFGGLLLSRVKRRA